MTLHNRSRKGIFLFTSTIQPLVFLRLLTWGMSCPLPLHSPALRSGDAVSPTAKAEKTTGASVKLFKEISPPSERLPSAPCRRSGLPFAGFRSRAGLHCLSSLQRVSFETRKKVTASRQDIKGSPDIYPGQKMPVDIIIPWFPQFIRFSLNSNSVIFTVRP